MSPLTRITQCFFENLDQNLRKPCPRLWQAARTARRSALVSWLRCGRIDVGFPPVVGFPQRWDTRVSGDPAGNCKSRLSGMVSTDSQLQMHLGLFESEFFFQNYLNFKAMSPPIRISQCRSRFLIVYSYNLFNFCLTPVPAHVRADMS